MNSIKNEKVVEEQRPEVELSEFLHALISDENLLSMPRMRLAFEIIDNEHIKKVEIQRIH